MLKACTLYFLYFLLNSVEATEDFKIDADDLFKQMVGDDLYKVRQSLKTATSPKTTTTPTIKTTREIIKNILTLAPEIRSLYPNISYEEIKARLQKLEVDRILEDNESPLPDFQHNSDDPSLQTRRFDTIVKHPPTKHKALRTVYEYFENGTRIYLEKNKTISLMAQFVYATRYKLPFAQMLRTKYNWHIKYKIGYCFALLRHLKSQQILLLSTIRTNKSYYATLYVHIKMYEKIMRLNIDIKDLILLIRSLDVIRLKAEVPEYYENYP